MYFLLLQRRTVGTVWRTVLEETDRVGRARLGAAEVYQQQLAEPLKGLRANKQQVGKKVMNESYKIGGIKYNVT